MSIRKRFSMFLFIELMIAVAIAVFIITGMIRKSPAIVQELEVVKSELVAHFTSLGYEENGHSTWIRPDPFDNIDSRIKIRFNNLGGLERIDCGASYINSQPASAIYDDMEATVQAMGGSLEEQKEDIMRVVGEIKNDQSSRTSGKMEGIRWGIESNTYSDGQGGKIRYVCFNAHAVFQE